MPQLPKARYFDRLTPPHVTTLVIVAGAGAIPMNIFLASLPEMAIYFDRPYSVMQFTLTGYLALTGLLQLIFGPLSDRFGRRPVILWTFLLFMFASVGATMTSNFELFMFFRCLQASTVSGFALSRAAVRDMVSRERAAAMLGIVAMGMALAPMMAPAFGGMLADIYGWQSNFHALTVIIGITLLVAFFDFGETNIHQSASFTEQFHAYPELFRSRRFWGYCFSLVFAVGTFFAYLGGAPFIGDKIFNLSATEVGIYLAITPFGYMIGNAISARFVESVGIYRMMIIGALVSLIGMSLSLVAPLLGITHPIGFYGFTISIGLGNGLIMPSANAGLLDVKPELAGSASGLGGSLTTFAGAGLSALSGFLLTESSGIYPLVYCVIGTSSLCLLAALYTIRIEKQMRG